MSKTRSEKYILICASCSWKLVSDLSDLNLYELKSDTMSSRKFRCPGCGRAISPRRADDPQSQQDDKAQSQRMIEENKKWIEENIKFQEEFAKEIKDE